MKTILMALLAVAFLFAGVGEVRAQASLFADHPDSLHIETPYTRQLQSSRAALERSIQHFWAVYYRQPYDYWTVVDAYYAYVNAYYTYRYYLDAYWRWQRERRSFAGRVMVDNSIPGVYYIRAPIDPVPGATVTLTNVVPPGSLMPVRILGRETTDASGNFEFRGLAAGAYRYAIAKSGYLTESGTVEVANARVHKTIFLRKTRRLTGTVVATHWFVGAPTHRHIPQSPVAGARVSLAYLNPTGPVALVLPIDTTDGQGRFSFENIPCTQVKVMVDASGYRRHEQVVTLDRNQEDVRIVLQSYPRPLAAPAAPQGAEAATSTNDVNNPFGQ